MTPITSTVTVADYERAFEHERAREYPSLDALESRFGFAVQRDRLETAARVLACPLKAHPPNWQHGRLIYAMTRRYLVERGQPVSILDIGTAKGFSALCFQWALDDANAIGTVVSVDTLDPERCDRRNSVLELSGPKKLREFLTAWPEADQITFRKSTGVEWLEAHHGRINIAFVDGKHTGSVVWREGQLLAQCQQSGDLVLFDDVQIDGVDMAVRQLKPLYATEVIEVTPDRRYALGVRRG